MKMSCFLSEFVDDKPVACHTLLERTVQTDKSCI